MKQYVRAHELEAQAAENLVQFIDRQGAFQEFAVGGWNEYFMFIDDNLQVDNILWLFISLYYL